MLPDGTPNIRAEALREWVADLEPESLTIASDKKQALDKLRRGEKIADEEVEELEAIVIAHARPAVAVANGLHFEPPWQHWNDDQRRMRLTHPCAAVGQLVVEGTETPFTGNAFLVGPELVITARHVVEPVVTGVGTDDLRFRPGCSVTIDFGNGTSRDASLVVGVVRVVLVHPDLDVAVLGVQPPQVSPLELSTADPGDLEGREVAVIGNPSYDLRYGREMQKLVLGAEPGIKRVMPGRVRKPRIARSLGESQVALTHDCVTLGGRSGAPVLDMQTGRVVGITFASQYLRANFATPSIELARDSRFSAVGVRFDSAVAFSGRTPRESPGTTAQAKAAMPGASGVVAASEGLRAEAERIIAESLTEPGAFRDFLKRHGYEEVAAAVPESGGTVELLRALERRGLLDESFLARLYSAFPTRAPVEPRMDEGRLPVIPSAVLNRLVGAVKGLDLQSMEFYAFGSKWRDYLLDAAGNVQSVASTIARLVTDRRPEAWKALGYLLRRLYQTSTVDTEASRTLYECLQQVEGQHAAEEAVQDTAAFEALPEPPPMLSIRYLEEGAVAARGVVMVRLQDLRVASTGWLLTPSLVVAPAHVFFTRSGHTLDISFSEEAARANAAAANVMFDFDTPESKGRTIAVKALEMVDPYLDIALLRLEEEVLDRLPLRIRPEPPDAALNGLALIHHPHMGPKVLSRDGRLLRREEHEIRYLVDSGPGSAGAPVFDNEWRVIGVHRLFLLLRSNAPGGEPIRVKIGTTTAALLDRLRNREGSRGAVWREIVAAQRALKMIDPGLQNPHPAEDTPDGVPVIVRLVDDSPLGPVPGFHADYQTGDVVTGMSTPQGAQELAKNPKVLSIEISRPSGSPECALSAPLIGTCKLHEPPHSERGEEALIAFIDSGIDVCHEAFRDAAGRTRIVAFWDQHDRRSRPGDATTQFAATESPEAEALARQLGVSYGALYIDRDIERFIHGTPFPPTYPPVIGMTHGTMVAGIAAGTSCGTGGEQFAGGVAPAARILAVRFDVQNSSIGYSKGHLDALSFIDAFASRLKMPVVVNISNGMNAGAHDGTSLLETQCDLFTGNGKAPGRVIVKSAGNERNGGRHATVEVPPGAATCLRWRSQSRDKHPPSLDTEILEMWFPSMNEYEFRLRTPRGSMSPAVDHEKYPLLHEFLDNRNLADVEYRRYHPDNGDSWLQIRISPGRAAAVEQGVWSVEIIGRAVKKAEPIHAWLELLPNRDVAFQNCLNPGYTVTIPGTAKHVICVGAVHTEDVMRVFEHSSEGPSRNGWEKPEVVAPGVGLFGAGASRGNLRTFRAESGTSLSAPHVTGAIALALSACVKSGRPWHTTTRIRPALIGTARFNHGRWYPGSGWGSLDAEALFLDLERA